MELEDAFEKERGRNGERELSSQELALELERWRKASGAGGRLRVDNLFVLDALNNLKCKTLINFQSHMHISNNIYAHLRQSCKNLRKLDSML